MLNVNISLILLNSLVRRYFHHPDFTEEESTESGSHLPKPTQQVKRRRKICTGASDMGLLSTSSNARRDLLPP